MIIYLASRYSRREELCGYRTLLQKHGHVVNARWLNGKHQISDAGVPIGDEGERLVEGDCGSTDPAAAALRQSFAEEDLRDLLEADCIISFTEPPRSTASRGGRHVEHGFVLGWNRIAAMEGLNTKRVIVVGYRENLFHWIPEVEFVDTWEQLLALLGQAV